MSKPEIWEVKVTAPNGDHATKLVSDTMVKLSVACSGLNGYATAVSLATYDFATKLMEAEDANTEGKTHRSDGQGAEQDQAERSSQG